jgi:undecaprenyl pyrophosphate phosphatase UppP
MLDPGDLSFSDHQEGDRMNALDTITLVVSLLAVLSISSERLVEIIKGWVPFLSKENEDANKERHRKWLLQLLAVGAGIVTASLAVPMFPSGIAPGPAQIVGLGFLASGGSGFWNAILGYLKGIKDIKQVQALEQKKSVAAAGDAQIRAKLLRAA